MMTINSITPKEVYEKLQKQQIVLVDIREKQETDDIWIDMPPVVYMPFSLLKTNINSLDKDSHIVLCCAIGLLSVEAAEFLLQNGFKSVDVLEGGILEWKESRLPMKSAVEMQCKCSCCSSHKTEE